MQDEPRHALTRALVLRTALGLIDERGLDALSMRTLAEALRVTPRALYRHVADKDDLLRGVCGQVLAAMDLEPAHLERRGWRERVAYMIGELRRTFMAHPQVVPVFAAAGSSPPEVLRVANVVLGAFRDGGSTPEASVRGFYALYNYLLGFVILEASIRIHGPVVELPTSDGVEGAKLEGLAPAAPFLARFALEGINVSDEQFELGVRALLDGLPSS